MQSFQYTMRTAYADTDQMGFVHHSSYVKYLENARWYAFRQMAIPYKEIEKNGILLPVIHLDIQFIRPLYYDDMVRIDVWIDLVRMTKLEVRYSIFNETNHLTTKASTTLAFLKSSTGKPMAIPEFLREKISLCLV